MKRALFASVVLTLLCSSGVRAQDGADASDRRQDAEPVKEQVQPKEEGAQAGLFYKAYYLEKAKRRFRAAIELYRDFLTQDAKSSLAPEAARHVIQLLIRVGKGDEARDLKKEYASLLKKQPKADGTTRDGRRRGAGNRGVGMIDRVERNIAKLEKQLEKARKSGEEQKAEKLERQLARLRAVLARQKRGQDGDRPVRRKGARRGAKPLAKMNEDELKTHLDRFAKNLERRLERLRKADQADKAEQLEESWAKYQELVKAGKFEAATAVRRKSLRLRR